MKAIARQVQISLITGETNPVVEWVYNWWNTLHSKEIEMYHYAQDGCEFAYYYVNYLDRKRLVFYHSNKKKELICSYHNYWLQLQTKFDIDYESIQIITKILYENMYNTELVMVSLQDSFEEKKMQELIDEV